jgi:hypothetical protein
VQTAPGAAAATANELRLAWRARSPPLPGSLAAIAVSLAADALLVVIGEAVFPSTKGYSHFRFTDR